jgi:sulfofructose kinase
MATEMGGGYALGIGVSVVDIIGKTWGFPEPDTYSLLIEYDRQVGGPVSNALVSLSRLGVPALWVGKVGDDEFGPLILDDMRREGIGLDADTDPTHPSPLSLIIVDAQTGKRSISFRPGCSFALGREVAMDVLQGASMIHLDGFFPDAALAAAAYGRDAGITVSLDAGTRFPELDEMLGMVDVFIPNLEVARDIAGEERVEECLAKISRMGPRTVVITCGEEGSWGSEGGKATRVEAVDVEVVDTTGCGDAYHGGFLYGELKGWSLQEKMLFASTYAALKATRLGGRSGLPDRDEMRAFIAAKGMELYLD